MGQSTNPKRSQGLERWLPGEPQSVDRAAWLTIAVVFAAIALLLLFGDNSVAAVRSFSWRDRILAVPDRAFIMTFNRPVDRETVEQNLTIEPTLPGRFSWSGSRMAYTVNAPVPYGQEFSLTLKGAQTQPIGVRQDIQTFEPFQGSFAGRDEVLAYVGVDGDEVDRLVLYDQTRQAKTLLTPPELRVTGFVPFPERDRILFGASFAEGASAGGETKADVPEQQLYTVTTGLKARSLTDESDPSSQLSNWGQTVQNWFQGNGPTAGELTLILDAQNYQNLKFDLAPNGRVIVIERVDRKKPDEYGLWAIVDGAPPQQVPTEQGGEFWIAPDSQSLAMTQGEGLAILPLPQTTPSAFSRRSAFQAKIEPLDFLPKFGYLLNFSPDGTAAALVKFNKDFTRSLYVARNTGQEVELGNIKGSIRSAEFSPDGKWLYCLLAEIIGDAAADNYQEQPYLAVIDLETEEIQPLLLLPNSQALEVDLSPDGRSLLFSRPALREGAETPKASDPGGDVGRIIGGIDELDITSQLLILKPQRTDDGEWVAKDPQALPLTGTQPRWLP
ncbi:MAG: hypothetical protein AAGF75_01570 [Cyanobacteria bacterium P01_H01_bin.130]